jgi:hypothetical protein
MEGTSANFPRSDLSFIIKAPEPTSVISSHHSTISPNINQHLIVPHQQSKFNKLTMEHQQQHNDPPPANQTRPRRSSSQYRADLALLVNGQATLQRDMSQLTATVTQQLANPFSSIQSITLNVRGPTDDRAAVRQEIAVNAVRAVREEGGPVAMGQHWRRIFRDLTPDQMEKLFGIITRAHGDVSRDMSDAQAPGADRLDEDALETEVPKAADALRAAEASNPGGAIGTAKVDDEADVLGHGIDLDDVHEAIPKGENLRSDDGEAGRGRAREYSDLDPHEDRTEENDIAGYQEEKAEDDVDNEDGHQITYEDYDFNDEANEDNEDDEDDEKTRQLIGIEDAHGSSEAPQNQSNRTLGNALLSSLQKDDLIALLTPQKLELEERVKLPRHQNPPPAPAADPGTAPPSKTQPPKGDPELQDTVNSLLRLNPLAPPPVAGPTTAPVLKTQPPKEPSRATAARPTERTSLISDAFTPRPD